MQWYIYIYIYIYEIWGFYNLLEGQFLLARESWVKFLVLQDGTQTDLSIKEAKHFDPRKI